MGSKYRWVQAGLPNSNKTWCRFILFDVGHRYVIFYSALLLSLRSLSGFLAIGYEDGQMIMVNMRVPEIMYREETPGKRRRSLLTDPARVFRWSMSVLGNRTYLSQVLR